MTLNLIDRLRECSQQPQPTLYNRGPVPPDLYLMNISADEANVILQFIDAGKGFIDALIKGDREKSEKYIPRMIDALVELGLKPS